MDDESLDTLQEGLEIAVKARAMWGAPTAFGWLCGVVEGVLKINGRDVDTGPLPKAMMVEGNPRE